MPVEVLRVEISGKSVLRNLMELYMHDFSEIDHRDVNEHGLFGYRYFDHYWTEPERMPFLIRADGQIAGFALLRRVDAASFSVSEFFVMRAHRRRGVGRAAMRVLFAELGGRWSFDVVERNTDALSFWRSVVRDAGGGDERPHDDDGQRVTRFTVELDQT